MKKLVQVLFVISLIFFSACSKSKNTEEISADQTQPQSQPQSQLQEQTQPQTPTQKTKVDYDLSNMNYNMLSSVTFDMLIDPDKYKDKTVKMAGQFYSEIYEEQRYYTIIVWDATQCCPAGMDFIPPENMIFPESFPEEESQITVTGILRENPDDGNLLFYANTVEF